MSLKTFHIIFIAVSTLTAFFFGVWAAYRGIVDQSGVLAVGAVLSFAVGVGLIFYGVSFVRKLKNAGIY